MFADYAKASEELAVAAPDHCPVTMGRMSPCRAESRYSKVSVHHPCVTKNITKTIVLDKAHIRKSN